MDDCQVIAPNPMLGSQLVCKSIVSPEGLAPVKQQSSNNNNNSSGDATPKKQQNKSPGQTTNSLPENENLSNGEPRNSSNLSQKDGANSAKLKSVLCQSNGAQTQQVEHRPLEAHCNGQQVQLAQHSSSGGLSAKDSELLAKEAQELKIRTRKLQLEIEEKNEIINVLRDELETLREQSDKIQRENLQLVKDAKRVKFLQDENDFLQDKVSSVEKLELEIKRLKEKLNELDFLKLRIGELEDDRNKAQDESNQFEDKWQKAEAKLTQVATLELELNKWKSFSQDLELERNSIQNKLLESIEQETKLNSINKKVEDEVKRLRDLIKSYEEQRDEEQASNSLIMSIADLKQFDERQQQTSPVAEAQRVSLEEKEQQTETSDTADKSVETDINLLNVGGQRKLEERLSIENSDLKNRLEKQECQLGELSSANSRIRNELDGNKKLISELRQDLACEKSLAQKLTNQLTSFTKQIKSLDKHYFPIHDTSLSDTTDKAHGSKRRTENSAAGNDLTSVKHAKTVPHKLKEHALAAVTSNGDSRATTNKAIELRSSCVNRYAEKKTTDNQIERTVVGSEGDASVRLVGPAGSKPEATSISQTTDHSKFDSRQRKLNAIDIADRETSQVKKGRESTAKNLLKIAIKQQTSCDSETIKADPSLLNCPSLEFANKAYVESDALKKPAFLETNESGQRELLSTASVVRSNSDAARSQAAEDFKKQKQLIVVAVDSESSPSTRKMPPTFLANGENEDGRQKNAHANTGTKSNVNELGSNAHQSILRSSSSSVSPSSNARSQSSTPTATANIRRDSGFHSINHDFNQSSPTGSASVRASPNGSNANELPVVKQQRDGSCNAPPQQQQTNRSTPITDGHVAQQPPLLPAAPIDRRNSSTPTQIKANCGAEAKSGGDATILHAADSANPISAATARNRDQRRNLVQRPGHTSPSSVENSLPASDGNRCASNSNSAGAKSSNGNNNNWSETTCSSRDSRALRANLSPSTSSAASDSRADAEQSKGNYRCDDKDGARNERCHPPKGETPILVGAKSEATSSSRHQQQSNFVRNSLPSRSVNFGHSARLPLAYLDKIRASVSATTTTTSNTMSSFTDGEPLSAGTRLAQNNAAKVDGGTQFALNCMLDDHKHSERCFAPASSVGPPSVQVSSSTSLLANGLNYAQHCNNNNPVHNAHYHHQIHLDDDSPLRSSRQLNALIDPVSHDQLMLSLFQQQLAASPNELHTHPVPPLPPPHRHHHHPHLHQNGAATADQKLPYGLPAAVGNQSAPVLTAEQLAHLKSLHQQHYFHHLHQLHQMHHHLHLHHLHQQRGATGPSSACGRTQIAKSQPTELAANLPLDLEGASQFSAPGGIYANELAATTGQPGVGGGGQQRSSSAAKLVSNNHTLQLDQRAQQVSLASNGLRQSSAQDFHRTFSSQRQQFASYGATYKPLAQIDETNGLPSVNHLQASPSQEQASKQRRRRAIATTEPTSSPASSPTSSAGSCNSSPSSASSSSSSSPSVNSLSAPSSLNRSAALRHTTTADIMNRRQFSVERELINPTPLTASLSRVGSCRSALRQSTNSTVCGGGGGADHNSIAPTKLRDPLKCQQPPPPMRTSKIVNVQQQSGGGSGGASNNPPTAAASPSAARQQRPLGDALNKLSSNLADIKLNDSVAFCSLRAPKKSSSGSSLNYSLADGKARRVAANFGAASASSSPEKRLGGGPTSKGADKSNQPPAKSSVWFEYGCV